MSGINLETLENAFRTWLRGILPAPWGTSGLVVWSHQNAPKPGASMVEIRRGNPYVRKLGRDIQGPVNPTTLAAPRAGTRELALSIRAYGPGATQALEDVRAVMDDDVALDALAAVDLILADTARGIDNLTALYGSQYKEVANLEIVLRTSSLRESDDAEASVGYIQAVDLEVTTQHPDGTETDETHRVGTPVGG